MRVILDSKNTFRETCESMQCLVVGTGIRKALRGLGRERGPLAGFRSGLRQ